MRLTIGKKISIAMTTMIVLVGMSALLTSLSIVSIQGDVHEMVTKSSPLMMATQAMIYNKTQASFQLQNYLTEKDPEKLDDIEKRYDELIAAHDLFEQKLYDAIDALPSANGTFKNTLNKGMQSITPLYREVSQQAFSTHRELLNTCSQRATCMDEHKEFGLKLLKLLGGMQDEYGGVIEINRPLMKLKTAHAMVILSEGGFISKALMITPEERLELRKEFAMQDGTFLEEFRLLKAAALQQNGPQTIEAIYQTHSDFVNSAVGEKRLFDLYETEFALLEKQKHFIARTNELDIADFAMATKLLELANANLSESGSSAYKKASNISNALLGFCVLALILSVSLTMILSRRISRPVLALASASSKIAAGDLSQKIEVSGDDEIGQLCRSFNKMSENLQQQVSIRKKGENEREKLLEILEEKNRELQNVVYVASHDLRSPLVTINGFSEELAILCDEIKDILESENIDQNIKDKIFPLLKEGIPEDLRFINAGAEKMQMLIGGLLQISRAGTTEVDMTPLNMNALLESICEAMQYDLTNKNITINLRDLPVCFGDANMINQVFSNLLDNAIKYRQNNGGDKIVVSGWAESGNSIYCVEDNGIGISMNNQEKIFEVFHRLDPHGEVNGEGLGLTIISRILDRHNGNIWVESQPGEGSRFFVSIPSGK